MVTPYQIIYNPMQKVHSISMEFSLHFSKRSFKAILCALLAKEFEELIHLRHTFTLGVVQTELFGIITSSKHSIKSA